MDTCPICKTEFKRHYRYGGQRQVYCSKSCKYKAESIACVCKTCGTPFLSNKLSNSKEYCSMACIERSPCQVCGTTITGRNKYQGGERRFCSRQCASIANNTLKSATKYTVFGFAKRIKECGELSCEQCGYTNTKGLTVHHKDKDRKNNHPSNLAVLCYNCHAIEHWGDSKNRDRDIKTALFLSKLPS